METERDHIWYAAYGSNLSFGRFMCYIEGGQAAGSGIINPGCRDKTPPETNGPVNIPHELYFAKVDEEWGNGGVCFIRNATNSKANTLGRKYLVTKGQFSDIINQENDSNTPLSFDFAEAERVGAKVIKQGAWYGEVLCLGRHDGYPVFTFTSENDLSDEINAPSIEYLTTIIRGLRETYQLGQSEIEDYLSQKEGIRGQPVERAIGQAIASIFGDN